MKISYHWLLELLDERAVPSPEKVEELLTFGAFEVEGVEKQKDDTVFDVKVLANRASDSLSHRGIAKEVAALTKSSLKNDPFTKHTFPKSTKGDVLKISVEDTALCDRYIGVLIEGVTVGPSPEWLKKRLEALGQRSINNIVDITNYVMLLTGQPLHAFDADKLQKENGGYHILVRKAKQGEDIVSLTGEMYPLGEEDLLITDGASGHPLGIAGVKGGKHAEITVDTKNIILEAAHFSWLSVRKTARRHALNTDASKRFENNPSLFLAKIGASHGGALIVELAGGAVADSEDTNPHQEPAKAIICTKDNIEGILGLSISDETLTSSLESLGCAVAHKGKEFVVTPPFERTDLSLVEDIAEEVGRLMGLGSIAPKALPDPYKAPEVLDGYAKETMVRQTLAAHGFSEIITTVFVPKGQGEIILENPIASDRPAMRNRIASFGFANALGLNTKNMPLWGAEEVMLFEIGTVFTKEGERTHLALGVHTKKEAKAKTLLDGAEEMLKNALSVSLQPISGKSAFIREYDLTKTFADMPKVSEYPRVLHADSAIRFSPISPYPFVLRDIAVWAPLGVEAKMVASRIDTAAGDLMVHRSLFDEFTRGNETSFAFHIVFQSGSRTLTAVEVNEHMQNVEDAMKKSGWTVR